MKKTLFLLMAISLSAKAQVSNYDYLFFCDQMMANTNNSIECLQHYYVDLNKFKKNPNFVFRHFDSYNCISQPDPRVYDRIKGSSDPFLKNINSQLWKLYNDCYAKNGEIVAYIRLQDYKTDLGKGFALLREMQQLQIAIGSARDQVAGKIANESKSAAATNSFTKPYQLLMKCILHEEELIRKLSGNFDDDVFIGFPQDEVLKSFLETDDMLKTLTAAKFNIPDPGYLNATIEGLQSIQQTKQHALDEFNNTSTFDGKYANQLYDNLQNYFNNDILSFYSNFCAQGRLNYYPRALREYDFDAPATPWQLTHLNYSSASLDSLAITKQAVALPTAGFKQLNDIVYYINECVLSLGDLFNELRSEEDTWPRMRTGKMPSKNPVIKFENFAVPVSQYGLILKEKESLPAPYRTSLVAKMNDLEQMMLSLQDHLMALSQHMSSGAFRGKGMDFIDQELKAIEMLYNEIDVRKEQLFVQTRMVYAAYPPKKVNSWTVAASALLKATDDSRRILKQTELRLYNKNESPIPTSSIHDDQRDLIINQMKYMNGIRRLGENNGLCPYNPYEYVPGHLKTLEKDISELPTEVDEEDLNETYGGVLYIHNIIVEQYNKFAELGFEPNEYSVNDPMRPVYILSYIRQPPKYHVVDPEPEEQKPAVPITPAKTEPPAEVISFEGYAFNNLVLLLDVSASMNKPGRLPLLKKSFQQLVRLMRKEDQVSIVIYSGKATLHLPPSSARDTTAIMNSIQNLRSEGATNIVDGLELAYKTANKNFINGGNNKIIMATDGEFNTSESLYQLAAKNSSTVNLSVFDFSERKDPLKPLQQLAEKGSGNYVKVTAGNSLQVLAKEAQKEK